MHLAPCCTWHLAPCRQENEREKARYLREKEAYERVTGHSLPVAKVGKLAFRKHQTYHWSTLNCVASKYINTL